MTTRTRTRRCRSTPPTSMPTSSPVSGARLSTPVRSDAGRLGGLRPPRLPGEPGPSVHAARQRRSTTRASTARRTRATRTESFNGVERPRHQGLRRLLVRPVRRQPAQRPQPQLHRRGHAARGQGAQPARDPARRLCASARWPSFPSRPPTSARRSPTPSPTCSTGTSSRAASSTTRPASTRSSGQLARRLHLRQRGPDCSPADGASTGSSAGWRPHLGRGGLRPASARRKPPSSCRISGSSATNLTLSAGVRLETLDNPNDPILNPNDPNGQGGVCGSPARSPIPKTSSRPVLASPGRRTTKTAVRFSVGPLLEPHPGSAVGAALHRQRRARRAAHHHLPAVQWPLHRRRRRARSLPAGVAAPPPPTAGGTPAGVERVNFGSITGGSAAPDVFTVDPDFENPYTDRVTLGAEREILPLIASASTSPTPRASNCSA